MYEYDKIDEIGKKLDGWEKDLNPVYDNSVAAFFGRIVRKFEMGFQKLNNYCFGNHEWESKQERYFNKLKEQRDEISGIFYTISNDYTKKRADADDLINEDINYKELTSLLSDQLKK